MMQHIHSVLHCTNFVLIFSDIFSSGRCQPKTFKVKIQSEKIAIFVNFNEETCWTPKMHAPDNQLEIDGIQFGRSQSAFYLINRQISIPFYLIILNATNAMEMDTRSENYIFISFRWKITVIYCFVACPLNEWSFLCPKVRRRFVGIVFALWFGPVTVYVYAVLLHVSTNEFQNEITPLYKQFQKEIMTSA